MQESCRIGSSLRLPLMKTHHPLFISILLSLSMSTRGQDNATPTAAAAQTEMQKWIATTDAQWQAAFKRDVTDVHEAELGKLKLQFLSSLDAAITKTSTAGDLDGAVALRSEQKRFAETNVFPEQDDAADPAAVKQLRAAIRTQIARLEKERAFRIKALHAKYDPVLAQAQTQLTQRQRIDDALLVKAKRDELAAEWLTPSVVALLGKAEPTAPVAGGAKPAATPKPVATTVGTRRIVFRATVDAGDNVVIKDGKLHIEHIDWSKPLNISINGVNWAPNWQDKITDDFTKFTPPLAPFAGRHVAVNLAKKVKNKGYVKVLEQPTDTNGQKLVIHLQDEGGGASDFEIHISW